MNKIMNKFFIVSMMFLMTVGFASAIVFNTQVLGTVYDGEGPVSGAAVNVTCNAIVKSTISDVDGTYLVTYPQEDCGFNTAVHVVATKDDLTGENDGLTCISSEICDGIPVALVDVTIPEFGIIAGGIALIGALGIFIYKRKQ